MNSSRSPSEQQVRALQEEKRTTLEQVKSLEYIITSGKIKVDEADQLRRLYIIKLKRDICMLETNVNNSSEENKDHVDLKIETEGDDIIKGINDDNFYPNQGIERPCIKVERIS